MYRLYVDVYSIYMEILCIYMYTAYVCIYDVYGLTSTSSTYGTHHCMTTFLPRQTEATHSSTSLEVTSLLPSTWKQTIT